MRGESTEFFHLEMRATISYRVKCTWYVVCFEVKIVFKGEKG